MVESCYRLFLSADLGGLVLTSQEMFKNLMKVEHVLIHLINSDSTALVTYHKEGRYTILPQEKSLHSGIVGQTLKRLRIFGPLLTEKSEYYDPFSGKHLYFKF